MNIKDNFEIAAGSVIGRDHTIANRNNQDGFSLVESENMIAAVVSDGCSDGSFNEIGALIGSRLIAEFLYKCPIFFIEPVTRESIEEYLEDIKKDVLLQIRTMARALSATKNFHQVVQNYFLFTVLGVIVTPAFTSIFGIGDGAYFLNGAIKVLGPFPDNAPPYLAYSGLVGSSLMSSAPHLLKLRVYEHVPTKEVQSLLIATDGFSDFVRACDKKIPGKQELVGNANQFWTRDAYFTNKDMVRRKLTLLNTPSHKPDWNERRIVHEGGILPDDTTLVVIRRKKE